MGPNREHEMLPSQPIWQYHAVLLYDLVGQSTKLRRLAAHPPAAQQQEELTRALAETAGAVLKMRQHMRLFYDNSIQSRIKADNLPPDMRALFERSRAINLVIRNFSDLTVAHTPLGERPGAPIPIASVVALVSAAAAMGIVSMAAGTPIRGAIDVGLALDMEGDEIYGPVLDQVYHAESHDADWPRILVGAGILDYLNELISVRPRSAEEQVRTGLAQLCVSLIGSVSDGRRIVDYFGAGTRTHMGKQLPAEAINLAIAFAEKQQALFAKQGDEKLASRYAKVLSYMRERANLWRRN